MLLLCLSLMSVLQALYHHGFVDVGAPRQELSIATEAMTIPNLNESERESGG